MTAISAEKVKELRKRTGAGFMDCKKALESMQGDMEKSVSYLRERGIAGALRKGDRATREGIVDSYIHGEGRIGVLVEVNCETDFVARTKEFRSLVRDVAMHVAAMQPQYVHHGEVPAEALEQEREVLKKQAMREGKPPAVVDRMVEGRLRKYCQEICLLDQPFVRDNSKTVGDLVKEKIAQLGENVTVRRFVRFVVGEGMDGET